jgi:hypothetical protein
MGSRQIIPLQQRAPPALEPRDGQRSSDAILRPTLPEAPHSAKLCNLLSLGLAFAGEQVFRSNHRRELPGKCSERPAQSRSRTKKFAEMRARTCTESAHKGHYLFDNTRNIFRSIMRIIRNLLVYSASPV